MTTTTAEKANEEVKAKGKTAPAAWVPVTLKNKRPAPFYYDDQNGAELADKGIALSAPVKMTEAQWKRRSPKVWGQHCAAGDIELRNIPEADAEAVEAAEQEEIQRLGRKNGLSQLERDVASNAHHIGRKG